MIHYHWDVLSIHADFRKMHSNLVVEHKMDILSRDNEIFSIIFVTKQNYCHFMIITFLSPYIVPPYERRYMSLVMRKPVFCICENKNADQLRDNRDADQHFCFRYTDSTNPLLPKSEISSL